MSLRSRLVAGFVLVAVVLVAADAIVGLLVHRSLIQSVDQRLAVARRPPRNEVAVPGAQGATPAAPPSGAAGGDRLRFPALTDLYVAIVLPNGTVDRQSPTAQSVTPPAIPGNLAKLAAPTGVAPKPFTVASEHGGGDGFRAVAFHTARNEVVLIAVSLHDTATTFRNVLVVEALATLAVLAALGLVAFFVLHLGVRPLDQMAATADAIAAGDLSRRVERAEPRTEAGRLGLALNTMLTEIEQAFAQGAESEARLRRFVADASHELRTPLTSIRGYTELWRQGALDDEDELADAMRRVEHEAARMGVLVDELLLLARLDQGRPLERAPVDLARVVRDAVRDAQAVEPDRPLSLDAPEQLVVDGDESRLNQVVANLLANARVHTPPGTAVRVRLAREHSLAVLEVADDGPGLGPDPARVFERFYRADASRARARGGSGLGLSIVAAVTEAHGGRATAGASASGGALVRVELPLAAVAPSPALQLT
ncbi:MAG TPA: HAMP domain-containing sensor histidine kinase [Acidimicrobiales bacterium]|nr:HAMP domain-containing sensor histidine kinase [Acidimicrobiales bacterium]